MKFCPECCAQLNDDAAFCTECGASFANQSYGKESPAQPFQPIQQPQYSHFPQYSQTQVGDPYPVNVTHRGFWWLGFVLPPLGLVFHIVWKRSKPRLSRSIGKGALVGAILNAAFYTFYIVLFVFGTFAELTYGI